ncbi:Uncharacterised protein [Mycobacteroides abscessus subsp. abscessus]|nr:Uncharacterised protein [Mycobacteroides abscessus subsp. abscessus]
MSRPHAGCANHRGSGDGDRSSSAAPKLAELAHSFPLTGFGCYPRETNSFPRVDLGGSRESSSTPVNTVFHRALRGVKVPAPSFHCCWPTLIGLQDHGPGLPQGPSVVAANVIRAISRRATATLSAISRFSYTITQGEFTSASGKVLTNGKHPAPAMPEATFHS